MGYELDIRTLSLATSIVSMILCLIMVYLYSTQKTYHGFQFWMYAAISLFAGMLLLSMRGIIPDFFTVIAANTFIAAYFALIPYGLNLFLKQNVSKWPYIWVIATFVFVFSYFTYMDPNIGARIIVISLLSLVFMIYSSNCVKRYSKAINIKPNTLLIYLFTVYSMYSVLRILYTFYYESFIIDFMSASVVQGITFFVFIVVSIGIFVGLIIYNLQRVERDFLDSVKEVKALQGIIPICMHCKGIRDDRGYWNQLEKYIAEHSDAEFSHGICEKCLKTHYPEIAD